MSFQLNSLKYATFHDWSFKCDSNRSRPTNHSTVCCLSFQTCETVRGSRITLERDIMSDMLWVSYVGVEFSKGRACATRMEVKWLKSPPKKETK